MSDPAQNLTEEQVKSGVKSDAARREEDILGFWETRQIFKQSVEKDAPKGDYIFYDGPPFATGLPHYGHIVASVIKDAIPRYFTMRGYRVPRRWGWDCHGLPIENIVEKELGFKHKKDIVALGIAKFNELCRSKVLTYADEWKRIIPRVGRWADMEDPYFTMSRDFMESVWWVFKQMYEKGLVYEDYRSMHICPRCETTLSQSEVAEGYKDVKDLSVTVRFRLANPAKFGVEGDVSILAWTTTPWTLPGNVALAVGRDIDYVLVSIVEEYNSLETIASYKSENLIIAKNRLSILTRKYAVRKEFKGKDLIGAAYVPIFDYFASDPTLKNHEHGWKIYAADFVTTDEGTGVVHIAPGFGSDDMALGKRENLPFIQHVGMDGVIRPEVKEFAGLSVKPIEDIQSTDVAIIKSLAARGLLFAKEKYEHSYPHCWRCDTPLINYATSSWFVKVEQLKPKLLETAKPIQWSPSHIKEGRFGKWLEGARDWSISRQRFWASAIPIWVCSICKKHRVFGSALELEGASKQKIADLHKHIVDEITITCECSGTMRRVPDVLDTWFDSGSMPYGQAHYPFENKQTFETSLPAQFIAEGLDQTRAWFYYLHVLAGAVFEKNAFQNVIVNGIVLAEDGKKMSKKLQNYPDPMAVVDKYGADALRFYLLSGPVMQAENLSFSEKGVDEVAKKNLGRLGNVLAFYKLYADGTLRDWKSDNILDRWILARLDELIRTSSNGFEKYQLDVATRPVSGFIDDLSVWYLRRSRDRFKDDGKDKAAALSTLRYVLLNLSKVIAPMMPFFAEYVFQEVKEEEDEESVHLANWPEPFATVNFIERVLGRGDDKEQLLAAMQIARDIVTQALEAREKAGIKVRQPLAALTITAEAKLPSEYFAIIAEEVNVKSVEVGKEFALDTTITDDLKEEGLVRELVRAIQQHRKDSGMKPGEPGVYTVAPESRATAEKHRSSIEMTTNTKLEFK